MRVIITHARSHFALVATQSLGKKGIDVITGDSVYPAMTFFSKFSKDYFIYPSPFLHPDEFLEVLEEKVRKTGCEVLMPMFEETHPIAKHLDRLSRYTTIPIPSYEKIQETRDKLNIVKIAPKVNVLTPKTYSINELNQVEEIGEKATYPLVIKLRRGYQSIGMEYVDSTQELITKYYKLVKRFNLKSDSYPIIQEYIKGTNLSVCMLFNHGRPIAKSAYRPYRTLPASGGTGTASISCKNESAQRSLERILKYLNWHGVACGDFILDEEGTPYLLEINPRFWGSLGNAVSAGVDFPYLLYRMALGEDIEPILNYKLGVKTRWLLGDIRAFPGNFLRSSKKLKTTFDFINFWEKGVTYDDLSLSDPSPFFAKLRYNLGQLVKRGSLSPIEKESIY